MKDQVNRQASGEMIKTNACFYHEVRRLLQMSKRLVDREGMGRLMGRTSGAITMINELN